MVQVNDKKICEVLKIMHEQLNRKVNPSKFGSEAIMLENRIIRIVGRDSDCTPDDCAEKLNEIYGYDVNSDDVIRVFRRMRMANPIERKEMFLWAFNVSCYFEKAISGDKSEYDKFEDLRHEYAVKNAGKYHDHQARIAAVMIYDLYPEIDTYGDSYIIDNLGKTILKYCLYDISDAIAEVYGYQTYRDKHSNGQSEKKLSYEQLVRKNSMLENALDRSNVMLKELQDEFDELIEEAKIKELTDFFSQLNSDKYGCILDQILSIRKGVETLRKNGYEIPVEINGILIMVKKLISFIRDNHINPIMKVNTLKDVKVSDIEFCDYDGTPFKNGEEIKHIKVISPGWIYQDKEIQISRPRLKEE